MSQIPQSWLAYKRERERKKKKKEGNKYAKIGEIRLLRKVYG